MKVFISPLSLVHSELCRTVYGFLLDPRSHCAETRHNPGFGIATKVMRCQIGYASLTGTSLHRIPNNIGCHTGFLSRSPLQNPPKYLSLDNSRMPEPSIEKLLAPRR